MNNLFLKLNPGWKKPFSQQPFIWNNVLTLILFLGFLNIAAEYFIRISNMAIDLKNAAVILLHCFVYFIFPIFAVSLKKISKEKILLLTSFYIPLLFYAIQVKNFPFWYGIFYIIWILIFYFIVKSDSSLKRLGLSFLNWKINIALGIAAGLFLSGHSFFVSSLSLNFHPKFVFNEFFPKVFLELCFGILGTELFFRGFVFKEFYEAGFGFLMSSVISTLLYLGPFLTNPTFTSNTALLVSIVFYISLMGFVFCFIFKNSKSIFGSYLANLMISAFRYLLF